MIQGGDIKNAGLASAEIKEILKRLGVNSSIIRRAAIASYEAEMNVVMYARHATLLLGVSPSEISIVVEDEGPGINDVSLAMQEGYSTATQEMREMGFGAGMGLPNIKKNADYMKIESIVGRGTRIILTINLN